MPTGPSTTTSPYLLPATATVRFTSIVTSGDGLITGGVFGGIPDGIGAFDNGDGTITVLINHEISSTSGIVRDHGSEGAYVDRLVIDKATLRVVSADDLIKSVFLWNDSTDSYVHNTTAFDKLCSSDLAAPTAFFNAASGLGTGARIYLTGEEASSVGRAFATLVTGPNAGQAFELPYFGNLAFENVVANPLAQDKTVVVVTDDVSGGQLYFYIGQKQSTGTDIQKAGLTGGDFFGLKVSGFSNESNGTAISGTFSLQEIGPGGDVSNMTGTQIESESDAEGVTGFLRPEDSAWNPDNPNILYFTTTNSFSSNSRLYQLTFTDIRNPQLGGTITALLDGSEGHHMLDNLTVAGGKIILQEDPGDRSHLAKVWEYDIASDTLKELAAFDPARFTTGGSSFITQDEESSGVLDVTALLGDSDTRAYLLGAQVHASTRGGQLMVMYVDASAQPPPPPPPPPAGTVTVSFTQGSAYQGTVDASVRLADPSRSSPESTTLYIDGGGDAAQVLLGFSNLFGSSTGQIPIGATVTAATLTLNTVNSSAAGATIYRMSVDWSESASWNSLGNGIQVGSETVATADLNTGAVATGLRAFDVTASLNAWLSGAATADAANQANDGWAFIANSSDGWDFTSSEGSSNRPILSVTYTTGGPPPPPPPPPSSTTVTFTEGSGGYQGTVDVSVRLAAPDRSSPSSTTLYIDGGSDAAQVLLGFNNLFGSGPGQIPIGATVTSATLTLSTVNSSAAGANLYRMSSDWSESASWNSLGNGIQVGIETVAAADLNTGAVATGLRAFDVTASLSAWLSGAPTADAANQANNGWAFIANSTDGWDFTSSEGSGNRPMLSVTYTLGDGSTATATMSGEALLAAPMVDRGRPDRLDCDDWGSPNGLLEMHIAAIGDCGFLI